MIRKQTERRFDGDLGDQYSLPSCSSQYSSLGCGELGPSTLEMLGVLRVFEDNDTGSESDWR